MGGEGGEARQGRMGGEGGEAREGRLGGGEEGEARVVGGRGARMGGVGGAGATRRRSPREPRVRGAVESQQEVELPTTGTIRNKMQAILAAQKAPHDEEEEKCIKIFWTTWCFVHLDD
jgi:hypothetical protein